MIAARKTRLFDAWFSRHAAGRIARTFGVVSVAGLDVARAAIARGPVLIVSNHTSWWDPLVIIYLSSRVLGSDGYALMDAANLRRLPFFGLVGGFGVDRQSAPDGARAIRYGASLLDRPGRLVWVFPQGAERPITERPLVFEGGGAALARVAKRATTLPVGLRYEFGPTERPELLIAIGDALPSERDVALGAAAQAAAVERQLDRIDRALCSGARADFAALVRAPPSKLAAIAERALAWLTRPPRALTDAAPR